MATYTVKSGDTLSKIAKQYGVGIPDITGYKSGNVNLIYPGEVLNIKDKLSSTPATSYISDGQNYIDNRKTANQDASLSAIKNDYKNYGLDQRLGDWVGSAEQYRAMSQYENNLKATSEKVDVIGEQNTGLRNQAIDYLKGLGYMSPDEGEIQSAIKEIQSGVAKKSDVNVGGYDTGNKVGDVGGAGDQVGGEEIGAGAGGKSDDGGYSNQPDDKYSGMSSADYQNVMDDVMDKIGTTDLATLISDYSSGDLTTPEMEISEADKQAQLDELKAKSASALQTLQQNMAKRGMTFSGIRGAKEEALAAETLALQAGINRDFASKIISAARKEQTRREDALKLAETNYNKALESQGYVYNPFTDTIEKTLERQKMEYDQSQTSLKDFPTSYQEWELAGGREGTGKTYAEYLSTESSNPTLDAIRMLTLSNMQSQYAPANGQLYYKATGKVATDLAASTVQKITILRTFSDSAKNLIPRIMSLLEDPDVDVSKAMGWFKQWGYQGFGKYLSGTALSNEKERSLMDLMTTLNNEYLYARSGAQINESEQARLSKTMPQTGLTSSENMNRLNNFAGTIDAILNENLKINGLGIWGEGTGATGAKNSNQEIMEDIEYLMSEQTGSSYSGIVNIVDKLFPLYPEYSRQEIMDMVNSY